MTGILIANYKHKPSATDWRHEYCGGGGCVGLWRVLGTTSFKCLANEVTHFEFSLLYPPKNLLCRSLNSVLTTNIILLP